MARPKFQRRIRLDSLSTTTPFRLNHRCCWSVWVTAILCLFLGVASGFADDEPKQIFPHGTVLDVNKRPIHGVQVTLHRWDGVFSPPLETVMTDAEGKFAFPSRANDTYYYFVLRKDSFATIDQIVSVDGPISATLRPAVQPWINVEDTTGASLKGARIVSISIRSDDNSEAYIWRGVEHLFGMEFAPSDESGRLTLPPLPEGAIIDIRVDHPQRAQTLLKNLQVANGSLGSVSMTNGVMTTFEFVVDERAPLALDGLSCDLLLMSKSSGSGESIRVPMRIAGHSLQFCAHPGKYDPVRLKIPGVTITPNNDSLTIESSAEKKVQFFVRKNMKITGRVIHADGSPHAGANVTAMTENISADGLVSTKDKMTFCSSVEADAAGQYSIELPIGPCRIDVDAEGYTADPDFFELKIQGDGPNVVPDFVIKPLEKINGVVADDTGHPIRDAIVRVRHPMVVENPQITDAEGRFQIALRRIPQDYTTRQKQFELDIVAFATNQAIMGVTRIDLRHADSLKDVTISLKPDPNTATLLSMEDNRWFAARMNDWVSEGKRDSYPAGEVGQVVPELDGAAWLNTDARSLKEFRGRYVLLDFWFIGCGPCHADLPNVKLVHERFVKQGVTVIGVHDRSSSPEIVQDFCRKHGIDYPTVVDHKDGRILEAYRNLGVNGFPTYILIDPDGKVLVNDRTTIGPSLRSFKVELIRQIVNERLQK